MLVNQTRRGKMMRWKRRTDTRETENGGGDHPERQGTREEDGGRRDKGGGAKGVEERVFEEFCGMA